MLYHNRHKHRIWIQDILCIILLLCTVILRTKPPGLWYSMYLFGTISGLLHSRNKGPSPYRMTWIQVDRLLSGEPYFGFLEVWKLSTKDTDNTCINIYSQLHLVSAYICLLCLRHFEYCSVNYLRCHYRFSLFTAFFGIINFYQFICR